MKRLLLLALLLAILPNTRAQTGKDSILLVIHGGAGTILKKNMTAEKEKAYTDKLNEALDKGYAVLSKGGSSIDAIEAVIRILEDSPLFNAGKGSVFNSEGRNEMDAAIMDGKTLNAGSIAAATTIKNPISAAKAVMLQSPHVMMIGKGAEDFAKLKGLEIVDPSYFYDEERHKQWEKVKQQMDSSGHGFMDLKKEYKYGTVGAVALDKNGNIAAGTSTGGMTFKKYGRVGDSPIIGAGTYANNNTCAVSCTGYGEYFIRSVASHDISALMEYKNLSVESATEEVLNKIAKLGGTGGIIALDRRGHFTMKFNTEGMYRGYIRANGTKEVLIYK